MTPKHHPYLLACLLFTLPATAQETRFPSPSPYRWLVSANPFGLAELVPSAVGLGVGYRLKDKIEIWAEPSLLFSSTDAMQQVGGYRVILQVKKFFGHDGRNFLALEGRIKSYRFNDTGVFYNPKTNIVVYDGAYHSRNFIYGGALQYGYRINIVPRSKHWLFEVTAGIGIKNKIIHFNGPPSGSQFRDTNIDLNVWDFLEKGGLAPYFPGSIRIVYTFGKK